MQLEACQALSADFQAVHLACLGLLKGPTLLAYSVTLSWSLKVWEAAQQVDAHSTTASACASLLGLMLLPAKPAGLRHLRLPHTA